MEGFTTEAVSLSTLSVTAVAVGLGLFLWALVGRPLKLGPFYELPKIVHPAKRALVVLIAFSLAGIGSFGIWYNIPRLESRPTLTVYSCLGSEERPVFDELVAQFGDEYGVDVKVENLHTTDMITKLREGEIVDLLVFDINDRAELVRTGLIEEFSEEKGLIPSSVNPVLLEHLEVDGKRYFAPYRPNVQLVFVNKEKFPGGNYPQTWQEVLEAAKRFHEEEGEARVVIQAGDDTLAMTLLQIIRAAGGEPCNLLDPQTKEALQFVRDLSPYVLPKSSRVDWNTASGYLLADSVYLARNWPFTLTIMHDAGRDEEFETYAG